MSRCLSAGGSFRTSGRIATAGCPAIAASRTISYGFGVGRLTFVISWYGSYFARLSRGACVKKIIAEDGKTGAVPGDFKPPGWGILRNFHHGPGGNGFGDSSGIVEAHDGLEESGFHGALDLILATVGPKPPARPRTTLGAFIQPDRLRGDGWRWR
jgi:hypothetical protein